MLARYLRTCQRPVRYALSPEQMRAVQNYLMMGTRAYDVPRQHTEAAPALLPMYHQFPRAGGALGNLLQTGDPTSLMAYLGMAEDAGASHPLLDVLARLHSHIQPGSPQFGPMQQLAQAHEHGNQSAWASRPRTQAFDRLMETLGDARLALLDPGAASSNTQLPLDVLTRMRPPLSRAGSAASVGHPMAPVHLHDLAHILRIHPQIGHYAGRQAEMVQDDAQTALGRHLSSLIPGHSLAFHGPSGLPQ